jgi:hypothetical protein
MFEGSDLRTLAIILLLGAMSFTLPHPLAAADVGDRSVYPTKTTACELPHIDEPPLHSMADHDTSVFRFYTSETSTLPMSAFLIRVETHRDGTPAEITVKRTSYVVEMAGGCYGHPTQPETAKRALSADELAGFRAAFKDLNICGVPRDGNEFGADGYVFTYEFANATRHCAAERWVPQDDAFARMATVVFQLANGTR